MLLIGDIHINARMKHVIIEKLRSIVASHDDEKHIVFMGDYVYHFAYDRKSLLALFQFFVELYKQGKCVYVLAGNHDWIAEHFVYEEARQAFDIVFEGGTSEDGFLKFITQPEWIEIENELVLFFPYNTDLVFDENLLVATYDDPHMQHIALLAKELLRSENKREKQSGLINMILLHELLEKDPMGKKVTIFHHYYVEGVQFPGQRGRFSFKDVSLAKQWLDIPSISMLSGHLHQPFVFKNYACLGSLWSTSPLEINHLKVYAKKNEDVLSVFPSHINYYCRIESKNSGISEPVLNQHLSALEQQLRDTMSPNEFFLSSFSDELSPPLESVYLQLIVPEMDYGQIHNYVDKNILDKLDTVRLKKQQQGLTSLMQKLDASGKNLESGFQDRKNILKDYIAIKYGDEQDVYKKLLRDMRVLS